MSKALRAEKLCELLSLNLAISTFNYYSKQQAPGRFSTQEFGNFYRGTAARKWVNWHTYKPLKRFSLKTPPLKVAKLLPIGSLVYYPFALK